MHRRHGRLVSCKSLVRLYEFSASEVIPGQENVAIRVLGGYDRCKGERTVRTLVPSAVGPLMLNTITVKF